MHLRFHNQIQRNMFSIFTQLYNFTWYKSDKYPIYHFTEDLQSMYFGTSFSIQDLMFNMFHLLLISIHRKTSVQILS